MSNGNQNQASNGVNLNLVFGIGLIGLGVVFLLGQHYLIEGIRLGRTWSI